MRHKIFRTISSVKLPRRGRAEQSDEYWREQKGIEVCPRCENAHFKKRWYESVKEIFRHHKNKDVNVYTKRHCPACDMINKRLFEGELAVEGIPRENKRELLNLVRNFGNREESMDPQKRIIKISETGNDIKVTTTENQMAEKLGKKIKEVFSYVNVKVKHSREPYEVTRVHAVFINQMA